MTIDAGLAEFQSTNSISGKIDWEWVAQQFAERDRLREEKRELVEALTKCRDELCGTPAYIKSNTWVAGIVAAIKQADTLLARVNAKESQ